MDMLAAEILKNHAPSVRLRGELELRIALATVRQAIRAGYTLVVNHTSDDFTDDVKLSATTGDIVDFMREVFACDDCRLYYYRRYSSPHADGWVYFVFGNDGWNVISDYTTNLESVLTDAQSIADQYA